MSLATELKEYGVDLGADEFNDLLADLHHALALAFNEEELICDPEVRESFVAAVQQRTSKELPEKVILRRLLNRRKNSLTVLRRPKAKTVPKLRSKPKAKRRRVATK